RSVSFAPTMVTLLYSFEPTFRKSSFSGAAGNEQPDKSRLLQIKNRKITACLWRTFRALTRIETLRLGSLKADCIKEHGCPHPRGCRGSRGGNSRMRASALHSRP